MLRPYVLRGRNVDSCRRAGACVVVLALRCGLLHRAAAARSFGDRGFIRNGIGPKRRAAMKHAAPLLSIVVVTACSQHNGTTNTTKAGPTQVFLIDAPFPYDQVARVDVYIVRVAAGTNPDTVGTGPGVIAAPHRAYNLLALGNGAAAKLGEGILLSGQYVQFLVTIDADSSSITLKDGTVLTNRTSPGIDWGGYPSRFSFGLFTDPPIQIADTGGVVIIDFDLGRSFYARD